MYRRYRYTEAVSMLSHSDQNGFSLAELVITLAVGTIIVITLYGFFSTSINNYFALQQDAVRFNALTSETQRIGRVIRGATDVLSASQNDLVVYAYFSPRDSVVSKIHYYVSDGKLLADVTPMSSSPPVGVPLTAQTSTHTIIEKLHTTADIFAYLDSAGNVLPSLTNLRDIKGIRISLGIPPSRGAVSKQTTLSLAVSLRNRKTNL